MNINRLTSLELYRFTFQHVISDTEQERRVHQQSLSEYLFSFFLVGWSDNFVLVKSSVNQ